MAYSPLISISQSSLVSNNTAFSNFDKTLFSLQSGDFVFTDLLVSNGSMVYASDAYAVNSIVFDVLNANLSLNGASVSGITTNYSAPVVYIENDQA